MIDLASDLKEFPFMVALYNAVQQAHSAMLVNRIESGKQHNRRRNRKYGSSQIRRTPNISLANSCGVSSMLERQRLYNSTRREIQCSPVERKRRTADGLMLAEGNAARSSSA
jgi:hypothetical protein